MAGRGSSAARALARAGGLAALLPYLIDGRIKARGEFCIHYSNKGQQRQNEGGFDIVRGWWESCKLAYEGGGRFRFTFFSFGFVEVVVHGVTFDGEQAAKLLPDPAPLSTDPVASVTRPAPQVRPVSDTALKECVEGIAWAEARPPAFEKVLLPLIRARLGDSVTVTRRRARAAVSQYAPRLLIPTKGRPAKTTPK
jgi:hypothetical protein